MNIFGSFTFGSLIKTFLPGFVCLFALYLLYVGAAQLKGSNIDPWVVLTLKDQAIVALLVIPASILLGLLLNILVFMGLNDRWVREPFRESNKEIYPLYAKLTQKLRDDCWTALALDERTLSANFKDHIDPDIILVERLGFEQIAYVREQYWYHLEFQLNLILSIMLLTPVLIGSIVIEKGMSAPLLLELLLILALAYLSIRILLSAAQKNYARHVAKICSLLIALLSRPEDAN